MVKVLLTSANYGATHHCRYLKGGNFKMQMFHGVHWNARTMSGYLTGHNLTLWEYLVFIIRPRTILCQGPTTHNRLILEVCRALWDGWISAQSCTISQRLDSICPVNWYRPYMGIWIHISYMDLENRPAISSNSELCLTKNGGKIRVQWIQHPPQLANLPTSSW